MDIVIEKYITIDLYGVSDDVLAEVGFYQFYDKSGNQFDSGKYVALWKRINGHWRRIVKVFPRANKDRPL